MNSLLEVPLLNEHYWTKIGTVRAGGIMLDLEDSIHDDAKVSAREWLINKLADISQFGAREIIVRVNKLSTAWGTDDLAALAKLNQPIIICYPKVESAAEVQEVVRLSRTHIVDRGIMVMVETASAVLELDAIAKSDGVIGLHFGYTDYAVDTGVQLYANDGDDLHHSLWGVRHQIAMVAAARGLFATGGTLVPEYRNLAKVQTFVRSWFDAGYTGILALSPSHLIAIDQAMLPNHDERERHEAIIAGFEHARAEGRSSHVIDEMLVTEATYLRSVTIMDRARSIPS